VPPVGPNSQLLGTINIANTNGGVNWPGSGFDPETGIFYTQASNSNVSVGKYDEEEFHRVNPEYQAKNRVPRWEAEPDYGMPRPAAPAAGQGQGRGGAAGAAPAAAPAAFPGGNGRQALGKGLDGLSLVKPPYGVMAAIDLKDGTLKWQVAHGDTPDNVRNSPALKGLNIPKTGQTGSVGVLVTKTLVIAGDPQVTNIAPRGRGAMLRAYNKDTGEQVGEVLMPAQISGSPMTYMIGNRQYIVVAVSGGNYTGEYIAFALPPSMTPQGTK
jgi:quinoprotein glucose dehydrogenase